MSFHRLCLMTDVGRILDPGSMRTTNQLELELPLHDHIKTKGDERAPTLTYTG